jgi:hypothetical protein
MGCVVQTPTALLRIISVAEGNAPVAKTEEGDSSANRYNGAFHFSATPTASDAAQGGPEFSVLFDDPPETAAMSDGLRQLRNSATRAEPRRAGSGGELLRD